MEGSIWLRLGLIGALTAGAVWVLLPSFVGGDTVTIAQVEDSRPAEPPLEVGFTVPDDAPDAATADAARARLAAAGLAPKRVAIDDGRLVVHLQPGQAKAAVEQALAAPLVVTAWPASAIGVDVAALTGQLPAEQQGAAFDAALAAAGPVSGDGALDLGWLAPVAEADGSVKVTFTNAPSPEVGPVVLAVDGDPLGWVAGGAPAGVPVPVRVVADDVAEAAARLVAPPLPEPLTRWTPEAAPAAEAAAEAAPAGSAVPPWLAGMLPKTAMTLGLDLQGGIDLTLQVDQDAAVVSAVQRDRKVLSDRATEAGKTIQVQRDRSRYALEISSDEAFDTLRAWVDDQLRGEYVYVESVERDGRTWNVWEMAAQRVADLSEQAVEQNLETLRKRIDATGVKEPSIVKMGGGRINIQLPGVTDTRSATDAIATQATLEFRLVDEDADPNAVQRAVTEAERALPKEQFEDVELLNDWLRAQGRLPEGRLVMWEYEETTPGVLERVAPLQLKEEVILTGADVENAGVGFDQNNLPRVLMDFKARGAQIFCDVTKANVGKRFAILLDGEIRSAPSIREAICGGSASIEMGSSANAIDDANTLALVLRSGALTAPVDIGEVRQIGASLGADAIRSGTQAAVIGSVLVGIFMFLWYRVPGLVADVAVALNVLFAFALLALFGATLTLPGIAGIALTVGMAVDANIIIYERIREELKLGVTARQAVDAGYEKALSAILDANITTAIAGVVLYSFGTGPIKGFAVTLLVGIVTTLATALYVTRALMDLLTRSATARLRL